MLPLQVDIVATPDTSVHMMSHAGLTFRYCQSLRNTARIRDDVSKLFATMLQILFTRHVHVYAVFPADKRFAKFSSH